MLIKNLFEKPINRRIDGVVKADQLEQEALWVELDEFVITGEVRKHMIAFFAAVKDSIDAPNDPAIAGRTGVWISGFFGSGKSMLLKILSLMMENRPVSAHGQTKRPLEFILPRIDDSLTVQDIEACCGHHMESILFNIDAKGDAAKGDAAVIDVFYRVFNQHRGRCAANPDVAEFEDALAEHGTLEVFVEAFESRTGRSWSECASFYNLFAKEINVTLQAVFDITEEDAKRQIDAIKGSAKLSAYHLAGLVNRYLEGRDPKARLLFFVDEVSQFIGKNGRLMLSLQTITEELGTKTKGRAWVVVTAQQDLEAIIGDLPERRANDFSKIQGRFKTKLNLSSSNADEVIQRRLLAKTDAAANAIKPQYDRLHDILRNALTFKSAGMTFQSIGGAKEFVEEYPFLPYQFQLLPKIFTAIRKRGATGQHLAEGERSMLDAFQIAAVAISDREVGALVPLHGFYASIESYLEAVVKRTIDQAAPQRGLGEFDVQLLKTLFLIRWVDEIKGNVETLVTLSLTHMDEDRASLKSQIEASLQKLEKETLISKSGENYYFLTDEEQAVDREIRQFTLQLGEDSRELGKMIYSDALKDASKYRYKNGKDFTVARFCDGRPVATASNPELEIRLITPFDGEYSLYEDDGKGIMVSAAENCLVIVLPDDRSLTDEIFKMLQVANYLKVKRSADLPKETKRIQEERATENDERRTRILNALRPTFASARFFVAGVKFQPKSAEPTTIWNEALEALIDSTFNQLGLLKKLSDKPQAELQLALKANDVQKQLLEVQQSENRDAIAAVKQRIEVLASQSKQISVSSLVEDFGRRPYGWPEWEVILILGRLLVTGDILLKADGSVLSLENCFDPLNKPGRWKQTIVEKKQALGEQELADARKLAQQLFQTAVPSLAEEVVRHIRKELQAWQVALNNARPYANQVNRYPGKGVIDSGITIVDQLLEESDSTRFVNGFLNRKDALTSFQSKFTLVAGFYTSQRPAWERILDAFEKTRPNEAAIREHDASAAEAIGTLRTIITSPEPYARIPEATQLCTKVEAANRAVIAAAQAKAKEAIHEVQENLDTTIADMPNEVAVELQKPLQDLKESIERETITSNLHQVRERAATVYNAIIEQINKQAQEAGTPPPPKAKPIRTIRPPAKTLETAAEVDTYLEALKAEILAAIEGGEKVQVQ